MSNEKLLNEVKLWPLKYGIPSAIEYKILCHLASPGEPRLYVQRIPGHGNRASVSNTAHEPGWSTRGSVDGLLNGCHYDARPWVKIDKETTRRVGRSITVYQISEAGYEAIVQYNARHRYNKEHLDLARRILKEERKAARALRPK